MLFEHGKSMGGTNEIKTKGIQQQPIPPMKKLIASGFNPRLCINTHNLFFGDFFAFSSQKR
jgi:hypothetical protein